MSASKATEAVRQYQATLEARRVAWDRATMTEVEAMDEELNRARRAMEVACLNEAVR